MLLLRSSARQQPTRALPPQMLGTFLPNFYLSRTLEVPTLSVVPLANPACFDCCQSRL